MYNYIIGGVKYKTVHNTQLTLASINPTALKHVSEAHYKAFNYALLDAYKRVDLLSMARRYVTVDVVKCDGRTRANRALSYFIVNDLFKLLARSGAFQRELMNCLTHGVKE